ncbi:hypothetical protein [Kribbella catacumbae]|uniref:hypothetical protein n=1 Tax=Kribbella catacumbae TaxID=460086 RepID=UPI000368E1AE|nr:hypothetical protein [Kribbella catacumbae]
MTDQELQTDLLRRVSLDQEARQRVEGYSEDARVAEWAAAREVDDDNTAWLYAVVAERCWPRICEVGEEAATAACLLAQHADDSTDLQLLFHSR